MDVYFDGGFYGSDISQNPCRPLRLRTSFQWKGDTWHLLAPYVCEKGVVLDFAKEVPREALIQFWEIWGERIRQYQEKSEEENAGLADRSRIDYENPMETELWMDAWINGQEIESISGSGCSYNPMEGWKEFSAAEAAEAEMEARKLLEHYELSDQCGWYFYRMRLKWNENPVPSELKLRLVLKPDQWNLPCEPGFKTKTGDEGQEYCFTHPLNGTEHMLLVESVTQEEVPEERFSLLGDEYCFPRNFQCLHYRLLNPEDFGKFQVRDLKQSDAPVRRDGRGEQGASSVFLVGALQKRQKRQEPSRMEQPSHMSFQPVEQTSWVVEAVVCRGEKLEMEWNLMENE